MITLLSPWATRRTRPWRPARPRVLGRHAPDGAVFAVGVDPTPSQEALRGTLKWPTACGWKAIGKGLRGTIADGVSGGPESSRSGPGVRYARRRLSVPLARSPSTPETSTYAPVRS